MVTMGRGSPGCGGQREGRIGVGGGHIIIIIIIMSVFLERFSM